MRRRRSHGEGGKEELEDDGETSEVVQNFQKATYGEKKQSNDEEIIVQP